MMAPSTRPIERRACIGKSPGVTAHGVATSNDANANTFAVAHYDEKFTQLLLDSLIELERKDRGLHRASFTKCTEEATRTSSCCLKCRKYGRVRYNRFHAFVRLLEPLQQVKENQVPGRVALLICYWRLGFAISPRFKYLVDVNTNC